MSVCKFCNTQNPEGVSFCSGCGNPMNTDTAVLDEVSAPEPVPPSQPYPEYKVPKKLIIGISVLCIALIEAIKYIFDYISAMHIYGYFDTEEAYIKRSNLTSMYNSAEGLCNIFIVIAVALLGIYLYNKGCKKNGHLCNTVSYTFIPIFACGVAFSSIALDVVSVITDAISQIAENTDSYNMREALFVVFSVIAIITKLAVIIIFNLRVFDKLAEHSNTIRRSFSVGLYSVPKKKLSKSVTVGILVCLLIQAVVLGLYQAVQFAYNMITMDSSNLDRSITGVIGTVMNSFFDALVSVSFVIILVIISKGIKAYNKECENNMTPGLCISVWLAVIPAGCYSIVLKVLRPIFILLITTVISQFNYALAYLPVTYNMIYSVVVDITVFVVTVLFCKALISKLEAFANKKRTAQPIMNDCAE